MCLFAGDSVCTDCQTHTWSITVGVNLQKSLLNEGRTQEREQSLQGYAVLESVHCELFTGAALCRSPRMYGEFLELADLKLIAQHHVCILDV